MMIPGGGSRLDGIRQKMGRRLDLNLASDDVFLAFLVRSPLPAQDCQRADLGLGISTLYGKV